MAVAVAVGVRVVLVLAAVAVAVAIIVVLTFLLWYLLLPLLLLPPFLFELVERRHEITPFLWHFRFTEFKSERPR